MNHSSDNKRKVVKSSLSAIYDKPIPSAGNCYLQTTATARRIAFPRTIITAAAVTLLLLFTLPAFAGINVPYLDAGGNPQTAASTDDLTGGGAATLDDAGASGGWYSVSGNITYTGRITISGNVHIILTDGCLLEAQEGINVTGANSLTIYAYSTV